MKAVLTKQNIVKEVYPDNYTLTYTINGLRVNGVLHTEYKPGNSKVENTIDVPTPIYKDIYKWNNGQWIMLESVNSLIQRIYAKCDQAIDKDPQGTAEEWQAYVDKVTAFKASILQTLGPWSVNISEYTVPDTIYLWELRSILKEKGLTASVETALNSLPIEIKDSALEAWNHATTIKRSSPTIKLIQTVLNLSTYEVDEIFRKATQISI